MTTFSSDLITEIIRCQDISEGEVFDVLASPDFDRHLPALIEELGLDEDITTDDLMDKYWLGCSSIIEDVRDSMAFDRGLRDYIEDKAAEEEDNVLGLISDGQIELFREIRLKTGPESLRDTLSHALGECWTPDKNKAHSYYGEGIPHAYIFHALAPKDAIDWENTLIRRCNLSIGEDEDEVTLIKGSKVELLGITHEHEGTRTEIDFADWLPSRVTI